MAKLAIYCDESPIDLKALSKSAYKVLKQKENLSLDVTFVGEEEIKELNKNMRNVDSVTDVLSFPMLDNIRGKILDKKDFPLDYDYDDKTLCLGSIVVCTKRAEQQAEEYGHSVSRELNYLVAHGILHLFGYDHEIEEDKAEMREKEELILSGVGEKR